MCHMEWNSVPSASASRELNRSEQNFIQLDNESRKPFPCSRKIKQESILESVSLIFDWETRQKLRLEQTLLSWSRTAPFRSEGVINDYDAHSSLGGSCHYLQKANISPAVPPQGKLIHSHHLPRYWWLPSPFLYI